MKSIQRDVNRLYCILTDPYPDLRWADHLIMLKVVQRIQKKLKTAARNGAT